MQTALEIKLRQIENKIAQITQTQINLSAEDRMGLESSGSEGVNNCLNCLRPVKPPTGRAPGAAHVFNWVNGFWANLNSLIFSVVVFILTLFRIPIGISVLIFSLVLF